MKNGYWKRILAMLLVFTMCISMFPASAFAEENDVDSVKDEITEISVVPVDEDKQESDDLKEEEPEPDDSGENDPEQVKDPETEEEQPDTSGEKTVIEDLMLKDSSGVEVTIPAAALPTGVSAENVTLNVRVLSEEECEMFMYVLGMIDVAAYDIQLIDSATGETVLPAEAVRVILPFSSQENGEVLSFVYDDEEDMLEQLTITGSNANSRTVSSNVLATFVIGVSSASERAIALLADDGTTELKNYVENRGGIFRYTLIDDDGKDMLYDEDGNKIDEPQLESNTSYYASLSVNSPNGMEQGIYTFVNKGVRGFVLTNNTKSGALQDASGTRVGSWEVKIQQEADGSYTFTYTLNFDVRTKYLTDVKVGIESEMLTGLAGTEHSFSDGDHISMKADEEIRVVKNGAKVAAVGATTVNNNANSRIFMWTVYVNRYFSDTSLNGGPNSILGQTITDTLKDKTTDIFSKDTQNWGVNVEIYEYDGTTNGKLIKSEKLPKKDVKWTDTTWSYTFPSGNNAKIGNTIIKESYCYKFTFYSENNDFGFKTASVIHHVNEVQIGKNTSTASRDTWTGTSGNDNELVAVDELLYNDARGKWETRWTGWSKYTPAADGLYRRLSSQMVLVPYRYQGGTAEVNKTGDKWTYVEGMGNTESYFIYGTSMDVELAGAEQKAYTFAEIDSGTVNMENVTYAYALLHEKDGVSGSTNSDSRFDDGQRHYATVMGLYLYNVCRCADSPEKCTAGEIVGTGNDAHCSAAELHAGKWFCPCIAVEKRQILKYSFQFSADYSETLASVQPMMSQLNSGESIRMYNRQISGAADVSTGSGYSWTGPTNAYQDSAEMPTLFAKKAPNTVQITFNEELRTIATYTLKLNESYAENFDKCVDSNENIIIDDTMTGLTLITEDDDETKSLASQYPITIEYKNQDGSKTGSLVQGKDFEISWDKDSRSAKITILTDTEENPDSNAKNVLKGTMLTIKYSALVDKSGEFGNRAEVKLYGVYMTGGSESVVNSSADSTAYRYGVSVTKVNEKGAVIKGSGKQATFALYLASDVAADGTIRSGATPIASGKTSTSTGKWSIETDLTSDVVLKAHEAYCLLETKAPTGYQKDPTPHYFYYCNNDHTVSKDVTGYSSIEKVTVTKGVAKVTYEVKVKNNPLTSVTVEKIWDDSSNAKTRRPEKIVVQLYANDKAVDGASYELKAADEKSGAADTWTHTWSNLDSVDADGKSIEYTVKELVDGKTLELNGKVDDYYTLTDSEKTGTVAKGFVVKLTNKYEDVTVTVKKDWSDSGDNSGRLDAISVTLMADGKAYGEAAELNKDNSWTKSWTGLPKGVTYSVKEAGETDGVIVGKSGAQYLVTYSDALTETGTITVTNTRVLPVSLVLSGTKAFLNYKGEKATLEGGEFTFEVALNGSGTDGVIMPDSTTTTNTAAGTFSFDTIKFVKAGTYQFTVSENEGSDDTLYDGTEYTVDVVVEQDGTQLKIKSVKSAGTALTLSSGKYQLPTHQNTEKTAEATFINEEPYGKLKLTKIVEGADITELPNFKFTVSGPQNYSKTVYYKEMTKGIITLDRLPIGEYTVVEDTASASVEGFIVQVSYKVNGTAATEAKVSVAANATAVAEVIVNNNYTPATTKFQLAATKVFVDYTGNSVESVPEFTFKATCTEAPTGATKPADMTVKNGSDGKITFPEISVDKAGTYKFTISEEAGTNTNYNYDTTTYEVIVTVEAGATGLTVTSVKAGTDSLTADGTTYELPKQEKEYEKTDLSTAKYSASFINDEKYGQLTLKKTVSGADNITELPNFKFTVTGPQNFSKDVYYSEMANGTVTLSHLLPGEYIIAEDPQSAAAAGYTVDVTYKINGEDAQTGTSATVEVTAGATAKAEVEFTNDYTPGTTKFQLVGTKVFVDYAGNSASSVPEFTFKAVCTAAPEKATKPADVSITNGTDGKFELPEISVSMAGKYKFTVSEVTGTDANINYDATTYEVVVEVGVDEAETGLEVKSIKVGDKALAASGTKYELPKQEKEYEKTDLSTAKYSASFINDEKYGQLTLKKTVSGADNITELPNFEFTVTGPQEYSKTVLYSEMAEGTITLNHLPLGEYTIAEDADSAAAAGYTVNVTYKINGEDAQTGTSATVEVTAGATAKAEVEFTNDYTPGTTKFQLVGTKVFVDYAGNSASSVPEFTFKAVCTAAPEKATKPADVTITNGTDGKFELPEISVSMAGEYKFTVSEVKGDNADYNYDEKTYEVAVTVEPNGSELTVASVKVGDTVLSADGIKYEIPKQEKEYEKSDLSKATYKASFINDEKYGQLTLTKTIKGAEKITPVPDFKFTVTGPQEYSKTVLYSEMAEGTITLNHLPLGEYTIAEDSESAAAAGYTVDVTYKVNGADAQTGTSATVEVTAGATAKAEVEFTNGYTPGTTKFQFTGTKAFIDFAGTVIEAVPEFDFTLICTAAPDENNKPAAQEKKNTSTGTITFDEIEVNEAGTYKFTIAEKAGTDTKITYDTKEYNVEVEVVAEGTELKVNSVKANSEEITGNGVYALPEQTVTDPNGATATASFVNPEKYGSLNVTKTFGADSDVTASDADLVKNLTFTVEGPATFGTSGKDTFTYAQMTNGVKEYPRVPLGRYTVTESNADIPGYNRTTVYTVQYGTVEAGQTVSLKVKNTYKAIFAQPEIQKQVADNTTAKDLTEEQLKDKTFTFTIEGMDDASKATLPKDYVNTVEAKHGETGTFAKIYYTENGTYTYKVTETVETPNPEGFMYSTSAVTVTVVVSGDTNHQTAKVSYAGGEGTDKNTFVNAYVDTEKEIILEKTISGDTTDLTVANMAGKFKFTLTAVETGNPMPEKTEATHAADGSVEFGKMTFKKAGIYNYTIEENQLNTSWSKMATLYVRVTVTEDNENHKLLSKLEYSTDGTSFVEKDKDTYSVDNPREDPEGETELTITKVVDPLKAIDAETLPNIDELKKLFTFKVTADAKTTIIRDSGLEAQIDTPMPTVTEAQNEDGGTVDFGKIKYTAAGTYVYKIKETANVYTAPDAEIYSSTVEITATVTATLSTEKNELLVDVKYSPSADAIVNKYEHSLPVDVDLAVLKLIDDQTADGSAPTIAEMAGKFSFTLIPGENTSLEASKRHKVDTPMPSADTVANDATGLAAFGTITFTEPGDYNYTIHENKAPNGYWKNGADVAVMVHVEKGENNQLVATIYYDGVEATDKSMTAKITNTYDNVELLVLKYWADLEDQCKERPESVFCKLYADGVCLDENGFYLTKAGGWYKTFKNLPKFNDDGTEIVYSVNERAIKDYGTWYRVDKIEGLHGYQIQVINTHKCVTYTGDDSSFMLWALSGLMSLGGAMGIGLFRKKKKNGMA